MALTNAEKQRAYRQRKAVTLGNVTIIEQLQKDIRRLRYQVVTISEQLQQLRDEVTLLSALPSRARTVKTLPSDSESMSLKKGSKEEESYGGSLFANPSTEAKPNGASHGQKKGTRLSPEWSPSLADRSFAIECGLDPDETFGAFRDYWLAKPGADATKLDWAATFRNWCRNQKRYNRAAEPHQTASERRRAAGREALMRAVFELEQEKR